MRTLAPLVTLAVLLVAACAPGAPRSVPRAYDVQVDAKASPFSIAVSAYFPLELQAHPGDTIRFSAIDRGELHTVTFGSLVESALAASANLPKERRPALAAFNLPAFLAGRPPMLSVNQSAAQPCFLESGAPPPSGACGKELQRQPDYSGKATFFNSGYLPGGAVFAVRLAETIAPGAYNYLCLLHGVDMSGRIVVVPPDEPAPTPDEARARGAAELDRVVRSLGGLVDASARAKGDAVIAGIPSNDIPGAQATVFGPAELVIGVGESVVWTLFGPHTISFNAPQDAVGTILRESDGSWALNPRAHEPANSLAVSPSTGPPVTVDSGTWDGRGFRSSGLIVSIAPALVSYRMTFTEAGTYPFKCLIHPDMEGTVKVGR